MATFYIQLEDRLLQISGELTAENISKALGYVPADSSALNNYATKDEVSDLVDMSMVEDLSQRVDNITFDSLKDNPFLQDGSGELNIVDEAGNIIAKIDAEGIHSVDFIAGNHKLTNKIDSSALNGYATEEWVEGKNYLTEHQNISHLATKQELQDLDFYAIKDNPIVNNGDGKLLFADENGYIGLQLESDGLYVKEVIAEGHKLTEKANKSELSNYATKAEVSDLVDMSVVEELQGKVEILVGEDTDKSVREIANDELVKQLLEGNNNFQTLQELSAWIDEHPDSAAMMNEAIQKNATDITNLDAAYKAADTKVLTDAQEYTDNINFYTIKDNPIVDGEAGSITFVDETGYIGLKVTEDGIIAKDVVTPEHTLSSKADKSFVEDNYYNKSTVDKKITEAVTGGQVSLDGFATEQWVNEQGFLKTHQDISHLAEKSELPKKVSDLENDKGYLTEHQDISHLATKAELPTKVSELENDSKFITIDEVPEVTVPTKTSDLTNDSGFITLADVPVQEIPEEYITETELNSKGYLTEHQDISHLATKAELPTVPTKVSELENDKGFLTEHQDISHLASRNWVESQGYAHQEDLLEISFNDIQGSPITIDESGELNFVDESGNVGFKVNEEGLYVKDVVAGDHKLSEKANSIDIPTHTSQLINNSGYITRTVVDQAITELVDGAPETLNTLNELASALKDNSDVVDVLNQSISSKQDTIADLATIREGAELGKTALQEVPEGYAKTEDIPSLDGYATEEWVNNKNYATEYDLKTIDFSSINNVPLNEDASGEFSIVDESGNVGMKVSSDAVYAKDFISGEHKLSEKANILDIPTKLSQLENDINITDKTISDGVYAVNTNGELINYSTADENCIGVALVAGEHKFMIAKNDATNDGSNYNLYWTNNTSDLSLTNYSKVDGTNGSGYLPKPDGTFGGSTHLSDDFTTWTNGALSDFNGKDNTEVIAAASSHAKDMCTVLNTFNQTEQTAGRSADWYVPACGQLALMYLNMTEINAALAKIGGTALAADCYWSSSEASSGNAWYVHFSIGSVNYNIGKDNYFRRVRFVRDISIPKSLKERVSDLESNKQDKLVSGTNIKTINGESILGEGDLSIQSANIVTLNIGSLPTQNSSVTVNLTEEQLIMLKSYDTVIKLTFNYLNKSHICTMFHTINNVTHVYSGVAYTVKNSVNYDTTRRYVYGQFSSISVSNTITFTISDIIVTESDVKTINGQSLIGSGDIVIEGGSSGGGAYAEVSHGTSDTTLTLTPNTFHMWDEVTSLDLSFAEEQAGVANEYLFQFTSGATATSLTLPDSIKWVNDNVPLIAENKIYQISVLKGLASVLEFSNASSAVIISFYVGDLMFETEEGMTWADFVDSEYNVYNHLTIKYFSTGGGSINFATNSGMVGKLIDSNGNVILETDVIIHNYEYDVRIEDF